MSDPGLTLPFVDQSGAAESRWIRLEQVGAAEQAVSFAEAADLVDGLYGVSPCDNDGEAGTGGEAEDDGRLIPEEDFLIRATERLRIPSCGEAAVWTVEVDVLRSHREGAWNLVSETATIGASAETTGRKTELVELSGAASYDLRYPYLGDLRVSGARVASVRGSTVNFVRPVTGWVRFSYTAVWDRVTVRVPARPDSTGVHRAEAAALLCFWSRLAAALDLEQPEDDSTLDALRQVCPRYRFKDKDEDEDGDCYEIVEHYMRCRCSGSEAPGAGWEEESRVACPDGVAAGAMVGRRRVSAGHTTCPGEEDGRLADREFFKETCCEYPPQFRTLPRCRAIYGEYRGGAGIEGGADRYKALYGEDVRLTAVAPEGGCGELVTRWNVRPENCCDDVVPLAAHPANPTEWREGEQHLVGALAETGREGDLTWTLHGGLQFLDGTTATITASRRLPVTTGERICPRPRIRIDDGCEPLDLYFDGGAASAPGFGEDNEDLALGPETTFSLTVGGGVPPYLWIVGGGLTLLGISADGKSAMMRTGREDAWCVEQVRARDQCGQEAAATIRNASTGRWVAMTAGVDYDPCAPPGAGPAETPACSGYMWLKPRGGYRVRIYRNGRQQCGTGNRVCGEGNIISTDGAATLAECCKRSDGRYNYSGGYCRYKAPSWQTESCFYYHDRASNVYQWIC